VAGGQQQTATCKPAVQRIDPNDRAITATGQFGPGELVIYRDRRWPVQYRTRRCRRSLMLQLLNAIAYDA